MDSSFEVLTNRTIAIVLALASVAALVVPTVRRERTWRAFFRGLVVALTGVLAPPLVFLLSAAFTPDWKGAAPHGWVETFHEGKLVLAPLVLYATAALYAFELGRPAWRGRAWVASGIFVGAVVSLVCLVHGALTIAWDDAGWGLVLPAYVAVWYGWRARSVAAAGALPARRVWTSVAAMLPFWGAAIWRSRELYRLLPDQPPDCFVVTAASRGHAAVVGPWMTFQQGERAVRATRQLATFWAFEALWRERAPRSHAWFRRRYDIWGYCSARCIRSPWIADAVHVGLRPLELVARLLLAVATRAR